MGGKKTLDATCCQQHIYRLTWVMCCWQHEWCVCLLDNMNSKLFLFFLFFLLSFLTCNKILSFLTCNQMFSQVSPLWVTDQLSCITKLKNKTMCVAGLEKRNKGRPRDEYMWVLISAASWKGSISPNQGKKKIK